MAELAMYTVNHRNFETTMKLDEEEAERLGATKVGDVAPGAVQPVTQPPYAVDVDSGEHLVTSEKKAPPARNKARTTK